MQKKDMLLRLVFRKLYRCENTVGHGSSTEAISAFGGLLQQLLKLGAIFPLVGDFRLANIVNN